MLENLRLDELTGNSIAEVLGQLFAKIPGWKTILPALEQFSDVLLVLGIILGLLQCLFGYRVRKYWTGFDCLAVFSVAGSIFAYQKGFGLGAVIAVSTGAGLVGCLFGYFLWLAGCVFRVFFFVSILVFAICTTYDLAVLGLIIGLAAGLIAGILAAAINKPFLIFYTSAAGAFTMVGCLSRLVPALKGIWFLPILIGGILAILGILLQAMMNQKKPARNTAAAKEETAIAVPEEGAKEGEIVIAVPEEGAREVETAIAVPEEGAKEVETAMAESEDCSNLEKVGSSTNQTESDSRFCAIGANIPNRTEFDLISSSLENDSSMTEGTEETTAALPGEDAGPALCPDCGAACAEGAKFCIKCGRRL